MGKSTAAEHEYIVCDCGCNHVMVLKNKQFDRRPVKPYAFQLERATYEALRSIHGKFGTWNNTFAHFVYEEQKRMAESTQRLLREKEVTSYDYDDARFPKRT